MPRRPRRSSSDDDLGDVADARANARARSRPRADRPPAAAPYSFIDDPQPAALTAMRSTPARSKASMVRRAKARASSQPARHAARSAPQQPWPAGATTSQPSAASTLTVAALTCGTTDAARSRSAGRPSGAGAGRRASARARRERATATVTRRRERASREGARACRCRAAAAARSRVAQALVLERQALQLDREFGARPRARTDPHGRSDRPARRRRTARAAPVTQPTTTSGASAMRSRRGNGNSAKIALAEQPVAERPRIAALDLRRASPR